MKELTFEMLIEMFKKRIEIRRRFKKEDLNGRVKNDLYVDGYLHALRDVEEYIDIDLTCLIKSYEKVRKQNSA